MIHVGLGFVLAKLHSLKGESSIYQFIASASMGVMKSSNRNSISAAAMMVALDLFISKNCF